MKKLTIEQIKSLEISTRVIATDRLTGEDMGQYRVINKGIFGCNLIKEDKFEHLSNGANPFLIKDNDVLTYLYFCENVIELYEVAEEEEREEEKVFKKVVSVLKENIHLVNPELRERVEFLARCITETLFMDLAGNNLKVEECDLSFSAFGLVDGLIIERAFGTTEWNIYFETEKEMSYNEAMKYLTIKDAKFRVESAIMDDLIETAIEYEDEHSMSDEEYDSLDDFLDTFLQDDYSSIHDIMKFLYFYGQPEDIQELVENGRWFMKK